MDDTKKKTNKDLIIETNTALELLEERTKMLEEFVRQRHLGDLRKFIETLTDKDLEYWSERHPQFKAMVLSEIKWRDEVKQ